jgi:glycogen phosphorylase
VAMRHGEVSQEMFPHFRINAITNGVHGTTWAAPSFAQLFDRHLPEWRRDNLYLRYAVGIPLVEIRQAHAAAKAELLKDVAERTGVHLQPDVLTIGFARRATEYKRSDLLFTDLDRLRRIATQAGALQVIYSGKAHPQDESGKAGIRRIFQAAAALAGSVSVIYLEEYDMALAQRLCAGVDLWLNTPHRPLEASGTSGMKAAINGVPSLSILDGWWIEGHAEGATGWAIGDESEPESDTAGEVASLYDKLERVIVPLFYGQPDAYAEVMRSAIALNGSFFNAQRMLSQYVTNAYAPQQGAS